jgi:mannose-6-phosphate isomerase-like protein (cupin superfamily)
MKPFVVAAGDSRSAKTAVLGGQILVKISGRDTEGTYAVFEIPTTPLSGPPLHFHEIEDEWFYGLKGEHDFQIGDERFHIGQGASIFAPKRIPHTWLNVGSSAGTMLTIAQPAGGVGTVLYRILQLDSDRSSRPNRNEPTVREVCNESRRPAATGVEIGLLL